MQPLTYCDDKPLPPKEEILHRLAGRAGRDALLEILRLLCPCRNTCRDPDVWRAVRSLYRHHVHEVREGAHHAVMSLQERARIDTQTAALLVEIGAGAGYQRRLQRLWKDGRVETPRPVRNDVPTLVEMLASDDPTEQEDALRVLFRADRHHVAGSVWREIERAARGHEEHLRARATIALRRIQERRSTAAELGGPGDKLPRPAVREGACQLVMALFSEHSEAWIAAWIAAWNSDLEGRK